MNEAYLFAGKRTPRGKASSRGGLNSVTPLQLVNAVLDALAASGQPCAKAEDLILGCATQVGEQGANMARTASLLAGLENVPGMTVNRFCASGIEAIALAAARIRAGDADYVLAGGAESVSRVPMFSDRGALYADTAIARSLGTVHMGIAADLAATVDGSKREDLDAYALQTREKGRAAWDAGRFADTVIPICRGPTTMPFEYDELLHFSPSATDLAAMPPAFSEMGAAGQDAVALDRYPQIKNLQHVHTRASSPAMADGAAVVAIGTMGAAERWGLTPLARIVGSMSVAADPVAMLTAGQTAAERLLARMGLACHDLAVVNFAEAFAALCLRLMKAMDMNHDRFNPDGGTIAMGHAFGATGAMLAIDTVRQLHAGAGRYGLVAVSGAAGLGAALLLERCDA